jgi:hypothetical protein
MTTATQFILVIMFFVTPPTGGKNRLWALQSTQTIEFDNQPACDDAIKNVILPAVKSTDTMALTAWCLPKTYQGEARATFFKEEKEGKLLTERATKKPNETFGTCYDYVPPPVNEHTPIEKRSAKVGLIGQCH